MSKNNWDALLMDFGYAEWCRYGHTRSTHLRESAQSSAADDFAPEPEGLLEIPSVEEYTREADQLLRRRFWNADYRN